ncbi:MAG: tRNA(Ile)(2)-agmatinylcytidine synthase [Nitrososphaeria archaeon]
MSKNKVIRLALDDVDSPTYGCTTFSLSLIINQLIEEKVKFLDYPHLVRLNPNIPWKTRGNGSVSLTVEHDDPEHIFRIAKKIVYKSYVEADKKSTPAIVLFYGQDLNDELISFSEEALYKVLSVKRAKLLLEKYNFLYKTYGGEIGLVGALSGLSNTLTEHTYEIICYRYPENYLKPRKIDPYSIIEMSNKTYPYTYNNYDPLTNRILITPHGPDPIFFGIRGLFPKILVKAFNMLKMEEKPSHYVIFKTNQGTNSHLKTLFKIKDIKPYYSVKVRGKVKTRPIIKEGGHVFFLLEDESSNITCAAYEPTKSFRKIILNLRPADIIEVGGGIRPPTKKDNMTLNIEYLKVLELAEDLSYENPKCSKCGRHMKSIGKGKGFKCDKCKIKSTTANKIAIKNPRNIKHDIYLPPPSAHRHLTKPLQYYRIDLTKNFLLEKNLFFKSFK